MTRGTLASCALLFWALHITQLEWKQGKELWVPEWPGKCQCLKRNGTLLSNLFIQLNKRFSIISQAVISVVCFVPSSLHDCPVFWFLLLIHWALRINVTTITSVRILRQVNLKTLATLNEVVKLSPCAAWVAILSIVLNLMCIQCSTYGKNTMSRTTTYSKLRGLVLDFQIIWLWSVFRCCAAGDKKYDCQVTLHESMMGGGWKWTWMHNENSNQFVCVCVRVKPAGHPGGVFPHKSGMGESCCLLCTCLPPFHFQSFSTSSPTFLLLFFSSSLTFHHHFLPFRWEGMQDFQPVACSFPTFTNTSILFHLYTECNIKYVSPSLISFWLFSLPACMHTHIFRLAVWKSCLCCSPPAFFYDVWPWGIEVLTILCQCLL